MLLDEKSFVSWSWSGYRFHDKLIMIWFGFHVARVSFLFDAPFKYLVQLKTIWEVNKLKT